MKRLLSLLFGITFSLFCSWGNAQVVVNMSNGSSTECEGILMDSDLGTPSGNYDHNENLTYTICVQAADSITLDFSEFCTEPVLDYIRFFNGPDTLSPPIGPSYSGSTLPPTILATNGCLTINFITDPNVACTGWIANWDVVIPDPVPPAMLFTPTAPTCSTNTVNLNFSYPIVCDSVYPQAFAIDAPLGLNISSISPINCVNGMATQFALTFSPGMNESGDYDFLFTYRYVDPCGELWVLQSNASMNVNNCPLQLELIALDSLICPGTCTQLIARVSGGTGPGTYTYAWSAGTTGSGDTVTVCPTATTAYSVLVDDAGPALYATASITIQTYNPPVVQADFSTCRNVGPYNLTATPPGGTWDGVGISNANNGTFEPWAGGGNSRYATYTDPNGCKDSLFITILPIWAGPDEASCPAAAPFQIAQPTPVGGTWSGPNVDAAGLFDPLTTGFYTLTYNAPNGCSDTKVVNVDNIVLPGTDSVCESLAEINLTANPFGGTWSGNGISDGYWGTFEPPTAGPGTSNLTYTINGCSSNFDIFVKTIQATPFIYACPLGGTLILPPATPPGGTWSGNGILDPNLGIFDPSTFVNGSNINNLYSLNGCTDTTVVRIRLTDIDTITAEFCPDGSPISLDFGYPGGGTWSGTAVSLSADPGEFDPNLTSPGSYTLYYAVNGCSDSATMIIRPRPTLLDTTVCTLAEAFIIPIDQPGGTWHGTGISDPDLGEFNASDANVGINTVWVESNIGCWDSVNVEVIQLNGAQIIGLENLYCFIDSVVVLSAIPPGGSFSGPGVFQDSLFNPSLALPGTKQVHYSYGGGNCLVQTDETVFIKDSIRASIYAPSDTVCYGKNSNFRVIATGGSGNEFSYNWTNPASTNESVSLVAEQSQTLLVTISDGCSKPVTDSLFLFVWPKIEVQFTTSTVKCYGEDGFALVEPANLPNLYAYNWENASPSNSDSITAQVGYEYRVEVTDLQNGCKLDTAIEIPGYSYVQAYFTPNPDGGCVPISTPDIGFVDLSTNGETGTWTFGDGNSAPYTFGQTPVNHYPDTGHYLVTLTLQGQGNCVDSFQMTVCVSPEVKLFVPNTFTPNADGPSRNEVFQAQAIGLSEFSMKIFNRWGQVIKVMNSLDESWDGTYLGAPVPSGFYTWAIVAKGKDVDRIRYIYETGTVYLAR
ncbi:MAG: gliding motility-associated C-terminal domain-containing protein [Bacteroidia bacterium]|nr:gliding motility-associated C-terminal domain-containing protein [Bacteroidia bacterium]